jgi:ADP-ribose pyrophosphatase
MMDDSKIKKVSRTEVYKGKKVNLVQEKVILPNGKETNWELVVHPGAAAVIPIDKDGKIIMVRQYRNATNRHTLEIPAGTLDKDEDPKKCAIRELEEETGYYCDSMEFLFKFYSCIGICDEVIHVYVAENLKETKQNLDDDEFVELERYSLDELVEMIYKGELLDNKTISSLLLYKDKYNK